MPESITIPLRSLQEAFTKLTELKAILGHTARLKDGLKLSVDLNHIDTLIESSMEKKARSRSQFEIPPSAIPPVERIDRVIFMTAEHQLELLKIDTEYEMAFSNADGVWERIEKAREEHLAAKRHLRLDILAVFVSIDTSGLTLIYGDRLFDSAVVLDNPDGRARTVDTLIHYTHPVSPEELYLREQRVSAKRIIRYQVPGLDDGDWMRQDEPQSDLDADAFRKIIRDRLLRTNP